MFVYLNIISFCLWNFLVQVYAINFVWNLGNCVKPCGIIHARVHGNAAFPVQNLNVCINFIFFLLKKLEIFWKFLIAAIFSVITIFLTSILTIVTVVATVILSIMAIISSIATIILTITTIFDSVSLTITSSIASSVLTEKFINILMLFAINYSL